MLASGPVSASGLDAACARLRSVLVDLGPVVVAVSGGADSTVLAMAARDARGADRAPVVTAVSASLAPDELADCRALADEWQLRWSTVETDEIHDPTYVVNDGDRCASCKSALMDAVAPIASDLGATVVLGVNVDDLGDHRPGQAAAAERGARFPLVDAGFTKEMVRAASQRMGLRTWDKPAAACLASRIPYGTPVTVEVLDRVGRAEGRLRRLGFGEVRVRHYGDTARLEVPLERLTDVVALRAEVVEAVSSVGYARVTLDLEGLRSGNLNEDLVSPSAQ